MDLPSFLELVSTLKLLEYLVTFTTWFFHPGPGVPVMEILVRIGTLVITGVVLGLIFTIRAERQVPLLATRALLTSGTVAAAWLVNTYARHDQWSLDTLDGNAKWWLIGTALVGFTPVLGRVALIVVCAAAISVPVTYHHLAADPPAHVTLLPLYALQDEDRGVTFWALKQIGSAPIPDLADLRAPPLDGTGIALLDRAANAYAQWQYQKMAEPFLTGVPVVTPRGDDPLELAQSISLPFLTLLFTFVAAAALFGQFIVGEATPAPGGTGGRGDPAGRPLTTAAPNPSGPDAPAEPLHPASPGGSSG